MNWHRFFTSPPPDTVWSIDRRIVAISRRDRGGVFRCAAAELPPSTLDLGGAGLQTVHPEAVAQVIGTLNATIASSTRPAIVVPTGWVRSFLIEGDDLPQRRSDLDDVLRWRLKKLLPVPPSDLRLAVAHQPAAGDRKQILCTAVQEKPIAAIEEVFRSLKIRPGLIIPRILSLSLVGESDRLIVEQDGDVLAFAVVSAGGIRLLRTKPLPENRNAWPDLQRELRLTLDYLRSGLGITGSLTARVTTEDPDVRLLFARVVHDADGLVEDHPSAGAVCPDAVLAQHLGESRLHPLAAVFEEGYPR